MKLIARFPIKNVLPFTLLLVCLLAGCGYPGTSANAGVQSPQAQGTVTPKESCPTEDAMSDARTSKVAYTVSWEAVGADADNNRGISALHVGALDLASGKLMWQKAPTKISALYQSSLQQVVDGVLYIAGIASQSTLVLAVDTRDGHAIWQSTGKQGGVSALNICAGQLYLRNGDAEITALRASDGKALWSYNPQNVSVSNPVVTTRAVYMLEQQPTSSGGANQTVIALNADNGQLLWQKAYGAGQPGARLSLIVKGSAVYIMNQVLTRAAGDPMMAPVASVQMLDGPSGKVLWQANMPANMEQINVLRVGATIYLNGQYLLDQKQSILVALNASDGKRLWTRKHSYNQLTTLSEQDIYGYKGYSGDDPQGKKQLCALDGATGKDRWCVDGLQPSLFSLSATRDTLIVEESLQPGPLTLIQNIYGVSKQNGKILWKLPWKSSSPSVQTLTLVTVMEK